MADNRINEASWDLVNSFHETSQTVANTLVAVQDRNMRFAQSIFLSGVEVLENQIENTRNLTQEWEQQVQKQQEAYQKLAYATVDIYMNFLRAPLSFYQQFMDATQTATRRGIEFAQSTTRQSVDAAAQAAQRTTRQAQEAAQKAGE
jgi:paraquat-inducible protein B